MLQKSKKNKLSILTAVGILLMAIPCYPKEEARYALIKSVTGKVEVLRESGEWQKATEGMILYEKDEIRTGKDSYTELLLDKNGSTGRLEVKQETRMRLNTLALNKESGDKKTLLDVAIGRVMIHVEKLTGDSKFDVKTPTSTMGVRGTVFEVVVEPKEAAKKEEKKLLEK